MLVSVGAGESRTPPADHGSRSPLLSKSKTSQTKFLALKLSVLLVRRLGLICLVSRPTYGTNYSVPRTIMKFGDGAFSVARPVMWNSLPVYSFKCRLKSHFFSLCFNDWQCLTLQVRFCAWRALNSLLLTYLLTTYYTTVSYGLPHPIISCNTWPRPAPSDWPRFCHMRGLQKISPLSQIFLRHLRPDLDLILNAKRSHGFKSKYDLIHRTFDSERTQYPATTTGVCRIWRKYRILVF